MPAGTPVNILLVDDQPAKLLSYEVILEQLGETLIRAGSAREALGCLLRTEVAVMLIDVNMPDLNGFELALMVREHPRFEQTAIIFVSATHMTDLDRLRGYEVGAVDYLPVPVVPDLLRAKVRVFADLYRKTRQLEQLNAELERRVAERTGELEASTKQLRQSEQRRTLALAAGRMGSWECDTATGIQTWDEGQHRIFGTDPSWFVPTREAWLGLVHADDRGPLRELIASATESGVSYSTEFRIQRPDGQVRWCSIGAAPTLDASNRVVRTSGVTHDLTERKATEAALLESEERLRIAQETSGIGIWDWDLKTNKIICIGDMYRLWGFDRAKPVSLHDTLGRIVHAEDRSWLWDEVQAALRGDKPYEAEFRAMTVDGVVRWLAAKGEVFKDSDGQPVRMIGTDIDVTERHQAAETLAAANTELERRVEERTQEREAALAQVHEMQKMESLGQLTGGVAHDFNNLLMAVLGNLSLLRKRLPDDPKLARLIDGAIQGAERGATLTKRMLAFARRQELKPASVDMPQLVEGMTDLLRRSLGPTIQIGTDFPDALPTVRVDPNQLELALLNLAVNARDAMPVGGQLAIAARCVFLRDEIPKDLPAGRYIRLAISDTGTGMDEATLRRATEPFFTTKGVGKGTGLGLSMVHGLAAQSGGLMQIMSQLGRGTTIELWLPVSDRDAGQQNLFLPSGVDSAALPTALEPCKVLVVDDDPLIVAGTVAMLEDMGHCTIEAPSALRALEILQSGAHIDLVITDHAMPGMTGLELAREVRKSLAEIPILIATGYADLPENEFGEFPRLAKPYRQEELACSMAEMLAEKRPSNVVSIDTARCA